MQGIKCYSGVILYTPSAIKVSSSKHSTMGSVHEIQVQNGIDGTWHDVLRTHDADEAAKVEQDIVDLLGPYYSADAAVAEFQRFKRKSAEIAAAKAEVEAVAVADAALETTEPPLINAPADEADANAS